MNTGKKNKDYVNANDRFKDYNSSERLHKHWMGMLYTDGVQALCDEFRCNWLFDQIMISQPEVMGEPYQFWRLENTGNYSAVLTCNDGNGKIIKNKKIELTDFEPNEATIWLIESVALLPSEY